MTSEIRANKQTNRVGLGTVEYTNTGIVVSGIVTATSFSGSGANLTGIDATSIKDSGGNIKIQAQASGAIHTGIHTFSSDLDVDGHTNLDNVSIAGVTTFASNIFLGDGDKIYLGADNDMYLWHTGSDGLLYNDTGNLFIRGGGGSLTLQSNQTKIRNDANNEDLAKFTANGAVELYYDNVKKFETSATGIILSSTDAGSSAEPEFVLYRDSASPADADYLGQIKFNGKSDTGAQRTYAKMTGKILDASNGTEDGIIEFAHIKGGSQNISARFRSDSLQLLNDTNLSVAGDTTLTGDLDVDGHTNLDNVSVAGVTTFTTTANFGSNGYISGAANFTLTSNKLRVTGSDTVGIECQRAGNATIQCTDTSNSTDLQLRAHASGGLVRTASNTALNLGTFQKNRIQITNDGKVQIGLPGSSTSLPGGVEVVNIRAMTDGNLHIRAIGSISGAPSGSGVGIDVLNDASNAVKDLALRGSTVIFKRASAETLRIDTSGRALFSGTLGYGNMPFGGNPSNAAIQIRCNDKYKGIAFGENAVSGAIGLGGVDTSTAMVFTANAHPANLGGGTHDIFEWWSGNSGGGGPGKYMTLDTSGDLTLEDGDLVIGTAGHGIDFSADGNGTLKSLPNSFNAELLHDYETGTFTPNIQYDTGTGRYAGSNVSSSSVGEYIRIGDLVSFGMKIILTGNRNYSENTHIYIGGMPYNGMHSSQQSSMQNGWGGWACPTNDNNFSYDVRYCFHGYTTVNLGFSQSSGNGGISGFYVWGFYRTAP